MRHQQGERDGNSKTKSSRSNVGSRRRGSVHGASAAPHQLGMDFDNRGQLGGSLRLIEQSLPISQRNPQVSQAAQDDAALGIGNDRHGALAFSGFAPGVQEYHVAGLPKKCASLSKYNAACGGGCATPRPNKGAVIAALRPTLSAPFPCRFLWNQSLWRRLADGKGLFFDRPPPF